MEAQSKGGYSTPSEYVRELIRVDRKQKAQERFEALMLEGISSGEGIPMDARFWSDLKKEARSKVVRRKNKSASK